MIIDTVIIFINTNYPGQEYLPNQSFNLYLAGSGAYSILYIFFTSMPNGFSTIESFQGKVVNCKLQIVTVALFVLHIEFALRQST